jgi:hypothetical protein
LPEGGDGKELELTLMAAMERRPEDHLRRQMGCRKVCWQSEVSSAAGSLSVLRRLFLLLTLFAPVSGLIKGRSSKFPRTYAEHHDAPCSFNNFVRKPACGVGGASQNCPRAIIKDSFSLSSTLHAASKMDGLCIFRIKKC